jgi:1,4-dihydroxy-2-naphthoyl-CoA hydrolase
MHADGVYQYRLTVPFQDIDAAGMVFYAHLFRYVHEAYEHFMKAAACPLDEVLADGSYLLPLVHAAADYSRPMRHADQLLIELQLKRLGRTSFTLSYRVLAEDRLEHARLETVHVALDSTTQRPMELPDRLRAALTRLHPGPGNSATE